MEKLFREKWKKQKYQTEWKGLIETKTKTEP